jgi:lipooligosaccharide transport system ATP-binding protein
VIEVAQPAQELRSYVQSQNLAYEDLGHRLVIYCDRRDDLYLKITRDFCKAGCTMRMATLEDVFLKLTGRELRE